MKSCAPTDDQVVKSHREVEGLEAVDFERFEIFLMDHYKMRSEESHMRLRAEIEKRFCCKNTKKELRSVMMTDLDYLTTSVVIRFVKINSKAQQIGGIKDFNAMLCTIIKHVYHEELRRILRLVSAHELDNPETPELPASDGRIDRELEEREEAELQNSCYWECLHKLPEDIRNIFFRYYENEDLTCGQLEEKRRLLALELEEIPAEEATEQQIKRAKNNLESRICKWRNNSLKPWKESCMKRRHSRR